MTDANQIIRAVNRAEEVHFILDGMSREQRRGESLGIQDGSTPGAPLDLGLSDQAQLIRESMIGWARLVHEEQGDPLPRDDMPTWALFLREHAIWASGALWADEMVDELGRYASAGIAMLGLYPRRTQLPQPCQCGAVQWVYHEQIAYTVCAAQHVASLAEAIDASVTRTFSCAEVAQILDVTPRTVERWVEDRKIATVSSNPVRISAIAVKARSVGLARRSAVA